MIEAFWKYYRLLIESKFIPRGIQSQISKLADKLHQKFFINRHQRVIPYKIKIRSTHALIWLDCFDYMDSLILQRPQYEKENCDLILRLLSKMEKPIFLDIGANVGYFSISLAAENPNAKIFSFEPSKRNAYVFSKSIKSNNFSNIHLIKKAVHSKNEKLILESKLFNSGSGSLCKMFGKDEVIDELLFKEEVECTRLDNFFVENNISRCDILKIDVQGAELEVLYSAEKYLKEKKIDYLIIENNFYGASSTDVRTYLETLGYMPHKISSRPEIVKKTSELLPKSDYLYTYKKLL